MSHCGCAGHLARMPPMLQEVSVAHAYDVELDSLIRLHSTAGSESHVVHTHMYLFLPDRINWFLAIGDDTVKLGR